MKALVMTPDRACAAIFRLTLVQEGVSWFDEQDSSNGIEQALVIAPAVAPSVSETPTAGAL
jgi:hypothetical protein